MNNDEIDVVKTSDFVLSSTLLCLGYDIIGIDKTDIKRVVFYFRKTSDLERVMDNFWRKEVKVEPVEFWRCQKEIRTRIYTDTDGKL